ncbi:MAG: hypothetical protein OEN50_03315 [Deltaproteobacteria bacterium]|nr:hypothetical protein [Deltaproteobacteria bacterium]
MGQMRIPADVTLDHYTAVKTLLNHVLQDLEATVGRGPKWVTCRLNQSGTENTNHAYFLGWLENKSLNQIRVAKKQSDPGLLRFMGPSVGDTYKRTLDAPTRVLKQDWTKKRTPSGLQLYLANGSFKVSSGNEKYRLSIAIKVDNRYVGTLNTGLNRDPGNALNGKLIKWAQNPTSELTQYLKNEFNLGGPLG